LIRKDAIIEVVNYIKNEPIVSANGFISRDLYEVNDKPTNFYMIGSMGLASSIGLGIAIKNPRKNVYVFDGDGNILMNLGSLITIGNIKPKNLIHIVFDNSSHESTGGQPTSSKNIKIDHIAKASNYTTFQTNSKIGLKRIFKKIEKISGPILILVNISNSKIKSKRVGIKATKIKNRFMSSVRN